MVEHVRLLAQPRVDTGDVVHALQQIGPRHLGPLAFLCVAKSVFLQQMAHRPIVSTADRRIGSRHAPGFLAGTHQTGTDDRDPFLPGLAAALPDRLPSLAGRLQRPVAFLVSHSNYGVIVSSRSRGGLFPDHRRTRFAERFDFTSFGRSAFGGRRRFNSGGSTGRSVGSAGR
jgi:hypothetical protein